jgi:hypothetical protein
MIVTTPSLNFVSIRRPHATLTEWDDVLTVPFDRRSHLDLPIMTFEMRDDLLCDLVLFVLGKSSAHAADRFQPVPQAHHHGKLEVFGTRPHAGISEQTENEVNEPCATSSKMEPVCPIPRAGRLIQRGASGIHSSMWWKPLAMNSACSPGCSNRSSLPNSLQSRQNLRQGKSPATIAKRNRLIVVRSIHRICVSGDLECAIAKSVHRQPSPWRCSP